MHNLHFFSNIVWNMSRIFPCLLESFMSRICPVLFVWNLYRIFSYLEYVQFYLSRICPEFFHVQNMSGKNSGIFHVQNLSGFLDMKNSRRSFFQTFSRHFLDMKKNSGQFPDNFNDIFWIFLFIGLVWNFCQNIMEEHLELFFVI